MKKIILKNLLDSKLVVIIRQLNSEYLLPTVNALIEGGVKNVEITFDSSGKFEDSTVSQQLALIAQVYGEKINLGAGTVMNEKQVELAFKAGAKYIISPNVDQRVIEKTLEYGLVSIPGAMTPTEAETANKYGADIVKLFPAGELGKNYIKALMAPLNHLCFMAVGGIDEKNIKDYIDLGIAGVGVGSNIIKKNLIENLQYDKITELALKYTNQIKY